MKFDTSYPDGLEDFGDWLSVLLVGGQRSPRRRNLCGGEVASFDADKPKELPACKLNGYIRDVGSGRVDEGHLDNDLCKDAGGQRDGGC